MRTLTKLVALAIFFGIFAGGALALASTGSTFDWQKPPEEVAGPEADYLCGLDTVVCEGEVMPEVRPAAISREIVVAEIKKQAAKYGVNEATALRIAKCESGYNHLARNKNSTAKGVFQFINETWRRNCAGDVLDYKANITCFMRFYPKFPGWWECR